MATPNDDELSNSLAKLNINGESKALQPETDPFRGVIRSSHTAIDVTKDFARASNALRVGQLVKDDTFSLSDSVQALELMDPKMDTGYLGPGESIDDDYDVCRNLLPEEILGILYQLLCCYISWLNGFPLAQNIFSCLYIDHLFSQEREDKEFPVFTRSKFMQNIKPMVHLVLRAYCIGIVKACDCAIEMMQSQHYFEEEDFNTHTFNRVLFQDLEDHKCQELLQEAADWVLAQEAIIDEPTRLAIGFRLTMCTSLYDMVLPSFTDSLDEDDWDMYINNLETMLPIPHEHLAKAVPEAFSPKVQRRLASTVPPRTIVEVKFEDAVSQLKSLWRDIQEALRIKTLRKNADLDQLITYLFAFSNRGDGPLPLARAIIQCVLLAPGNIADGGEDAGLDTEKGINRFIMNLVMKNKTEEQGVLGRSIEDDELHPSHPDHRAATLFQWYAEQAKPEFLNVIKALCQNRSRIRRCLVNVAQDFDTLHVEVIDKFFNGVEPLMPSQVGGGDPVIELTWPLWRMSQRFEWRILEWINRLGFELDIYKSDEYCHMYRYLAVQWETQLKRVEQTEAEEVANLDLKKVFGGKVTPSPFLIRLRNEIIVCQAMSTMANGLFQMYAILDGLRLLQKRALGLSRRHPFRTLPLYAEARTKPFANLRFGIDFELQEAYADVEGSEEEFKKDIEDLLGATQTRLKDATVLLKELLKVGVADPKAVDAVGSEDAWKKDTQGALRACVQASVNNMKLTLGLKKYGGDADELAKHVTIVDGKVRAGCWIVAEIIVN